MKTKLAQKPQSSIVKFTPPLPEVIRQSKEIQQLKKEKSALMKRFSALMKDEDRRQAWCTRAEELEAEGKAWEKRSKAKFEPWRAEAHEAHVLVTSTMNDFVADVESAVRVTAGTRARALLKAQADMRLAQANIDANQAKENAERGDGEEIPAPLLAPEIEGKTGRKIWGAGNEYSLRALITAAAHDPESYEDFLQPNWLNIHKQCQITRELTNIPGIEVGYKIAGTDVFVKVNP